MLLLYTFCGENARVLIAEKTGIFLDSLTKRKNRAAPEPGIARFGMQERCIL